MAILVVAATEFEVRTLIGGLELAPQEGSLWQGWAGHQRVDCLVTGIGMVNTALHLGRHLVRVPDYDRVLNLGVCGSFDGALPLTTVVEIVEDTYAELGAEDGPNFLTMTDLGFAAADINGQRHGNTLANPSPLGHWPAATALTVNKVHGHAPSIEAARQRWGKRTESMEGAAFFQTCLEAGLPFAALRAVSNEGAPRNLGKWRLRDAAEAAQQAAIAWLRQA